MYRSTLLATLAALTLSIGCLGSLDTGPVQGDDDDDDTTAPDAGSAASQGRSMFDLSVKPLMARCSSCHAGTATYPLQYLGPGPDAQYYDSLVAHPEVTGGFDPAIASLITKLQGGTHQGLADWTATEEQSISSWLLTEKEERGGGIGGGDDDPPVNSDSQQALAEWSGCMLKTNWDTAQMGTWSDKNAEGGTVCSSCHNDGLQRFNANADNDTMFEMNKYEVFIISFFTVKTNLDSTVEVIPAYDKIVRMGNGSTLHPTFNTDLADQYFVRLQNFYDLTKQAKTNGQCGPAVFPQP
ncbi:MAG TPA: hypothetical protein VL172_12545 [Kofleriaceae bacterium]|jgi:mono/diheme cytochrome c family protein|nr:hypothetical protein [Kofleriaceae bacterium]